MDSGLELKDPLTDSEPGSTTPLHLLVELPSRYDIFRANLRDILRPSQEPPLRLASKPGDFWPDVFVPSRLPWSQFFESGLGHVVFALLLWGSSLLWARRPEIAMPPPFSHQDVIYYQASELLPPLNTGNAHPKAAVKGQPAYAPQPIISVPQEADNHRQTIVTPPQIKLSHDVPLPNVVSWPKTPLAVPIAATARTVLPKTRSLDAPVVEPPPDVKLAATRRELRTLQPSVVQPAQQVNDLSTRRLGDISIAPSQVVAPAPQLPVAAQRIATGPAGIGSATAVPPPPSVSGNGVATSGSRMIALGLNPSAVAAPVEPPSGNRRGSFAATPDGKPGAAGTPNIAGSGQDTHGGNGNRSDVPSGLYVGANPDAKSSPIGGNGQGHSTNGGNGSAQSADGTLMAKATPPHVSSSPERQAAQVTGTPDEAEQKVFAGREVYAMTLNVSNLNSSSGSWVIHFAEMHGDGRIAENGVYHKETGTLIAPSATHMVDPAYPLEIMRQHVQGTVTLYAVIRPDGSVSDVRVLNGIDDRLDEYARQALSRWHFTPASKNGAPVALEAVVKVPFRASRARSTF